MNELCVILHIKLIDEIFTPYYTYPKSKPWLAKNKPKLGLELIQHQKSVKILNYVLKKNAKALLSDISENCFKK